MKITGDQSDLSISQAGTGTAAPQCEDPSKQIPITQLPGPIENMDGSHNGELTAPGTEGASEGSSVVAQNEGSSQSVTNTEDTESKPMEITQTPAAEEKEGESKDLKTTDLSSDDEVKRDSSKKKSKKHKKHKSKKKKKKKKKEKNEKRSKSTSSIEDQENASSESKSVWQPAIASPREQDTSNTVSSQMEEKADALPSLGGEDSDKEHPARPQLDIDSGFFGPKCPSEMHISVSSNLAISEVEMPEQSKELAVDIQQNNEEKKLIEINNVKQHTNCETAEALQKEMTLPHPGLVLFEGKSVELQEKRVDSEENKHLKHLDDVSSVPLQPQSISTSTSLLKLTAKSRSRSNSLAKENRSRSKSLTKVPKKQVSSKSLTRQRSRSSSIVRRRRSRSSSVGQRRRSKSKSPVRRRRSHSSTPARYSKSPIRSWWSKSIRNRQRSVSIERRRRSRTRSLAKRRRSRSRSSEKGRHSRTRSSAKRIGSRSRSANRRRKSRSTSRKRRLRSRSTSRRKSKSNSPSRKRKSKSASPLRRQKSKTASPVRRGRSRSRSAVQKRRSRSSAASRKHKSRSGSGSRRRKSRSGSFTRRRRSRSGLASRRRKSRSGSIFRRRRSRSIVAFRRRRSRSPSISRKRRSRSLSASRRRRSRSASRRRRSRSASASRRRRSRSASRRRRSRSASRKRRSRSTSASRRRLSRSVSKRRKSRSTSTSRRRRRSASRRRRSSSAMAFRSRRSRSASRSRKSRSASASGRHKSRSDSRRRRSRSDSASRRRRSRSDSALRRRRSKSDSLSRQQKSRFGSVSKTRKSRSGSGTRSSQQKSQSYSTTKRKSRSTSVSRGEQSTLQSSIGKDQSKDRMLNSSLERRSRSKGENQKSSSKSVTLKSLESEPKLQSKSSTEQSQLETVSASTMESTVEKQDTIKLRDRSSTSVIESKSCSSQSGTSSPGTIPISCTENAVQVESNILDCSSTTSVLEDQKKSAYSECPTEQIISTSVALINENSSAECDMDIDPIPYTPIEIGCTEQTTEVVNIVETSKELFDDKNDYTKLVDIRINEEPEQKTLDYTAEEGTVFKPFSSSPNIGRGHGLSQLSREYIGSKFCDERTGAVPVEDPSCHDKCENMESKAEFAICSDSVVKTSIKAGENSMSHVAPSPNLKLSTIDSLLSCTELLKDSGSIKYVENPDKEVPEIKYLKRKSSISSAVSDCSNLTTRQDIPVLLAESQVKDLHSSSTIERRSSSPLLTSNNKLDLLHNKQESITASSLISNEGQQTLSSVFPGSQKHTEEAVSPLDEDNLNKRSESKEEILEASKSELQSSSPDICLSTETESRSASSCVTQSYLLDNPTYDYNFKEKGESEVSYKTLEVIPVKENKQTLSSENICEDLGSTFQAEKSSSYEVNLVNTSQVHGPDKQNVHRLLKGDNIESTSMDEHSAPKDAVQNSLNPPNVDYHEISSAKEATTNIKSLTKAHVSSKLSSSPTINDSSSEKNPQYMSVPLARKDLPLLPEDKMEIQTNYEALSKTKNLESFSDECKIVSKPSPFNNVNDSCTKREVDKVLYDEAAQVENSANSIPSNKQEVIHNIGKTSSREQNSSSVLHSKKQGSSSSSKTYDRNLECVQLGVQENELTQSISGHSVSKSSKSDCLTNSTDDKVHVTDDSSQELSVKSGPGSRLNVYNQQEFVPKNKERVNLEKESSFQSLADLKQCELKIRPQSALNYSKPEPAYIGLKESKPQEDPKLLPKTFLHETGRLSVSTVPVQFKFSKTFKTLAVSQLCSASEDSSDVESSKVNTSSSSVARNTTASASGTPRSSSKTLLDLPTTQLTANVIVEPSMSESSQDVSTELSQSDNQSGQLSEKDLSQPDNLQAADDSQTGSSTKPTFPHISNAVSKLGVKQRQYRSRSVAQHSRTPSVDRGHASRSRSKSLSRRRRSKSKSSSRKKRSSSTSRKKSSHSKSVRRKRSRSRSRGRKGRSQSKSKGKKKRSTSKISGKRKRSRSKSSEKIVGSKSSGKQRGSRSTSKSRKNRLQSTSPEKKGRSRSKSESKKNLHSKTASTRKRSRSKSPNRRRKSRSKSLSSRSRSRSVSASWKNFSHSKSSLRRKRSSSRSASPRRRSRSRNKRHSLSRSPAARSNSRSRSRWHRSRSRGRWRRSRSLSASRRRSRSTSAKKRKSLSPARRRRSRSQIKQKEKSPISKRKSTTPPPAQKKSAQPKPAGFKHSIGLKSLIQKQLSQAKSQGSTGKLSKEQIPLPNLTSRTQLSIFSTRTQASVSNLSSIGQIPIPNLAEVPLPSVSSGSQIPMPSVPPAEPLSVSSLAAETQLSVPDLTTANQWHVPDMSSTAPWSVPDIAAGAQWSMADLGTGTQWPMSDLAAASHWPMHDLSVGAQWSMPDLAAGTQWAVPDVASGAQWAVPDLAAGTQWTVPDLHAGSQWAMTNLTAGAQWAVPDLAVTAQWAVPDLTAGAQIQRADLAPEAQVPGSDLAPEAQVPGSDLATEAQVPGSDLAAEAQVPGSDMVAEAQVPPEHDLTSEEHNVMPDVAAEALVPVASSTIVPDVAAGIPLPDVAVGAQMPVPDVAATIYTIHMPDVATEAQKQLSNLVAAQAYISLTPEESEDSHFRESILTSAHETETDSGDAFVQESSFEPNVNTSLNLKMEESSGQQVPLDCFENSQSTELSDKTVLVEKQDQQLNQGPETDLLNVPQVETIMDSESHLSSETCSSSDIPIASSDYSGHSVSSDHSQEQSLFEGRKSTDASLQCEPHAGSVFVESQTSPIQTEFVEPSDDQRLLAVKNSMADNLQVKPYDSSDHTLVEEPYSKSVCSKWVVPSTPETILQNEPSINSNTTLDINSHSISDPNEIEACVPNHSQQVDQNTRLSLPHPTEHYTSPEHPQLVEPYASPEHPQLVEPYTSPVHPQLVEPYLSPEHPPLVELYSSPEPPQLVEPYASPDFPQLVEPYSSPDHQPLVEPFTVSQHTQICQPSMSPAMTESTCSPAERPDKCSISENILTDAAVTCTQINTDSSSSDNSEVIYQSVAPDVPKRPDETDSDYPQLSKSNHASVSLQEVPCPSPLKAYSLESSFSPKETSAEECSLIKRQSVEPSVGYNLEHPTSPIQLLTEQPCSPHPANQDPQFPITDYKLDSPCISTSQQLLKEEIVTDKWSEEMSTKEDLQSDKDFLSSEQVQEKLYSIPVQSREDFPSPAVPHTNEPCFNAADAPLSEYEHPPAEDPRSHAENNVCIPVISNTIINLHGGDQYCTIIPSPNRPEQETVAEHSLSEESKATSVLSDTIINLHGEDQSSTIIPSPNRPEQETVAEHSLSEESKATSVLSDTIINLHGGDQSCTIIPSPNRPEQETVAEHSLSEESKATSVLSDTIINLHGEDQSSTIIPSPNRPEQETVAEHSLSEESKATSVLSDTIINLHGGDQSCTIIPSPNIPEQETVAEHSLSEESKATSVLSDTVINLHGEDQSSTIIPSPNRPEQETVAEHSLSEESKATSVLSDTVINLHGEDQSSTIIPSPNRPEQETVAEHSLSEESKATSVLSDTIINLHGEDQSSTIIPSPNRPEQETVEEYSLSEESKATSGSGFPDHLVATQVDKFLHKPSPSSDSVVFHDSQGSCCSSPPRKMSNFPNSLFPEDSSDADHSMPSEYSTKTNQGPDHSIKTDSPNISVFQSQEFDRCVENPLPTENIQFSADLPCLNKDKLQCLTSNQALDMSEGIKHKLEDSVECIKTENHFTTTPPDLLPYDSDQPTDMCSEPSSEPVPFNSQPPPELLPYDSEQPANSFLSILDYSTEQGSSDFHAPPELLPYDSDQPIVLHKQQTEPTAEELLVNDSTTIHHETYKALDVPSVDSEENCGNSASLNMHEDTCEPSNETVNLQLIYVKEVSSECSVVEIPSTEHVFSSETVQGPSVPSAVVCTQEEDSSSSWFSADKHLSTQQIAEEQPVVQTVLGSDIPERPVCMSENQTELTPLLTDISEVQSTSSELVNTSETATVLPSIQDEISLEAAGKSPPPKSLMNAECPQLQPVSRKTVPISDLGSRREHSRSRSIDAKESRSKSVSKNKRARSKSATPTKKSHSKSLVRSRRSKSRSASTESNRHSPVVKKRESTKRSSRSASVGRRRRSHTSSVSPRKRSRSPSVGHKSQRRRSQSRQRHSRSPTEFHRQSRSPSVTSRRRSPSSSVTRKKISPSPVTRRRRSPSPRRKRSPSPPSRRRRSPSPPLRRRRTPSPSASRRRHSPSLTRKRRSRSPSATRRKLSPSPSTTRRRRSPSPSINRRRWSPSPSSTRRRRSPSSSTTRKRRSPTPSATRRRRTPSPSASRRRRSPSPEFRKKRSPSLPVSHKRRSHSPSAPKKQLSRSPSASRRKRSRSASLRKRSCSPSAPIKRRSKSKSPSKSPTGTQSKYDRSRSLSHSEVSLRKRKTRSRSSSRDKKTVEKRRKRSSSKDSSKDYYSTKQRRKSRTPPRRKKSRSPVRRASVCKSPVRRRRSRSPVRRKSFSRSPIRRKRSRSRDKSMDSARSPKRLTDLDKAQLLEIAKANAAAMCAKAGVPLPASLKPAISPATPMDDKITQRTFGGTIQELTEKCKQIAQSKEDDVIVNKPHDSDDEEEDRPFYNHPFKVSEHKPISFSLLNPSLKPAPKNQVTLTKEFPVSSGSQHRKKEDKVYGEWVPVDKNTEESKDDVFTNTGPAQPVDITSAMTERAAAQTRLTGNPYDIEALYMLNRAQEQIDAWAQSTSIPGQFTGSTGAQVLSAEEISNSGPQAWLKKDQFLKAAPVTGGRGALLMRKMGWKEGEGLGRHNEGNVDPILLDFKTDRKGLVADGEKASNKLALPAMKDLSGKHPISALMELCNKKKWSPPDFELVDDTGPEHRKRFLFRVTVNGVLCQPSQPSVTKKLAKATAAAAALQALGALPKENMTSTSNFCSASSSML